MTKRMVTIMTAVLLMVMIGIGGAILYNFTKLGQSLDKGTACSASNPPVYHFMAILDGTDPSFPLRCFRTPLFSIRTRPMPFRMNLAKALL